MQIEDMRIGGLYLHDGKVVKCVALSSARSRGDDPGAAFEDGYMWLWKPSDEFHPLSLRDLWPEAAALYTSPKEVAP